MAAPVGSLAIVLDAQLNRAIADFNRAGGAVDAFGRRSGTSLSLARMHAERLKASIATLGAAASPLARLPGMLGFAGAGLGIAGLTRTVGQFISEASGLAKAADRIGLTTDALQELRHAATLADVDLGALDSSMHIFARTIGEAVQGKGDFLRVLEANGVALRTQDGRVRSTNDILADYADLVKNAGSEAERLRLAQLAFGRSGADLVTMLQNGSVGLRENAEEARKLGLVIDEELLRKSEKLADDWARLTGRMSTAFKTFVLEVANGVALTVDDLGKLKAALDGLQTRSRDHAAGAFVGGIRPDRNYPAGPTPQTIAELQAALGLNLPSGKPTVLPGSSGSGSSTSPRDREREAVTKLLDALQAEVDLLCKSDIEKRVANSLRQAGSAATAEERAQIEALTRAIYQGEAAFAAAAERATFFSEEVYRGIEGLLIEGRSGIDVVNDLAKALARAALQAALLGTGPLAGLFGGGSGILGGITSSIRMPMTTGALFHAGGQVGAGGMTRRVPSAIFAGAPRFHTGLRSNERAAIFEKGEQVLTASLAAREARTVAGLAAVAPHGGGGTGTMPAIHIHEAPGTATEVTQAPDDSLHIYTRQMLGQIAKDVASNGVVGKTIANTFNVSRRKR